MSEPIFLRRLKTRDGVLGPIEQINDPRPQYMRALSSKLAGMRCEELVVMPALPESHRRYTLRKQVQAILLEMEEE